MTTIPVSPQFSYVYYGTVTDSPYEVSCLRATQHLLAYRGDSSRNSQKNLAAAPHYASYFATSTPSRQRSMPTERAASKAKSNSRSAGQAPSPQNVARDTVSSSPFFQRTQWMTDDNIRGPTGQNSAAGTSALTILDKMDEGMANQRSRLAIRMH